MSAHPTPADAEPLVFVKARFDGETRFFFTKPDGSTTTRRVHAALIPRSQATDLAQRTAADGKRFGVAETVVSSQGRVLARFAAPA